MDVVLCCVCCWGSHEHCALNAVPMCLSSGAESGWPLGQDTSHIQKYSVNELYGRETLQSVAFD